MDWHVWVSQNFIPQAAIILAMVWKIGRYFTALNDTMKDLSVRVTKLERTIDKNNGLYP